MLKHPALPRYLNWSEAKVRIMISWIVLTMIEFSIKYRVGYIIRKSSA